MQSNILCNLTNHFVKCFVWTFFLAIIMSNGQEWSLNPFEDTFSKHVAKFLVLRSRRVFLFYFVKCNLLQCFLEKHFLLKLWHRAARTSCSFGVAIPFGIAIYSDDKTNLNTCRIHCSWVFGNETMQVLRNFVIFCRNVWVDRFKSIRQSRKNRNRYLIAGHSHRTRERRCLILCSSRCVPIHCTKTTKKTPR